MGRFIIRRVIAMILVLFAISILTFAIFNVIPGGDPAVRLAGRNATKEQKDLIRKDFGFDKSKPEQYVTLMGKIFDGSLISYTTRLNVWDEIKKGLPRTFCLAIGAALLWMIMAVALGLYTALRAGQVSDRLLTVLALVGVSMPVFWVGALMNYFLGFKWGIFPNGGYVPFAESPWQWFTHLVMPWTALSLLFIGVYSRVLRSNILDTMNDDYVRTARAKGLSERQVLLRHVLRNSMIPVVTLWGLDFGAVLGRRGHPHRDRVRPPGSGPVRPRVRAEPGPVGHGHDHPVRRLLHRVPEHHRGHRLRAARPEDPADMSEPLLSVRELAVSFQTEEGSVTAVDGVSLELAPGEILAVVGESGSGKSVTAMTLMGLTRSPNATFGGEALYRDTELVGADDETLRKIRGAEIAMIFQDPMTSLNPVQKIGHQIEEQILVHMDVTDTEARERSIELLERGGHPARPGPRGPLPPRVLRRHAPAGHDRPGAVV